MKWLVAACLLCGTIGARPLTPSTIIALVDLTYKTPASYRRFIALSEAAGITVRHVLPSTRLEQALCGSDAVFVVLDDQFLTGNTWYATQIKKVLARFARRSHAMIGLLLDETTVEDLYHEGIVRCARAVFGGTINDDAIWRFLEHIRNPTPLYPTSFSLATDRVWGALPTIQQVTWLPQQRSLRFLNNTVPLAMLMQLADGRMLFIAPQSHLFFAELEEWVHVNPLDNKQRKALFKAVLQTMSAVQKELATAKKDRVIKPNMRVLDQLAASPAQRACTLYKKQQGVYQWTSNGISCAWMSVDYDHDLMTRNLAFVAQADFDMLWLELPLGIYQHSGAFDEKVAYFTQQLANAYAQVGKPLPKIFLDFNVGAIAQWFASKTHPIDWYQTVYDALPAPLDFDGFWHPAVIEVFRAVCERWRTVGNGVPIDGVMINFYWWHTQQAAWYTNTMDVSDHAWRVYGAQANADEREKLSSYDITQRIAYLFDGHLPAYQRALEQEAEHLAHRIITDIRSVVPCAMMAAYTAVPFDSWFYRAMMRGLGTQEQPLLWFTNNTDFYSHQAWIKDQQIHALHATNILLAHFNNRTDTTIINRLAPSHDGLWYSRASRIGQSWQAGQWWSLEATTMKPEKVVQLINKQTKKP